MTIYISIIIYTLFTAYLYCHIKKRMVFRVGKVSIYPEKSIMFLVMTVPSIMVAGLRYGISVDYTKIYEKGFYTIVNQGMGAVEFETLFLVLVSICSRIINEPWFMFLIVSMITIIIFFLSFRYSENFFLSVALFFGIGCYFDTFNGIRQYIVVAVFCYVIKYIKERNFKKYVIALSICILIHVSAIFTIPFYFLYKVKMNKMHVFCLSVFLLALSGKLLDLIIFVMELIPKYNLYIIRNTLGNQVSFSLSGLITVIIALIPCLIVEKEMKKSDFGNFLYNIMMIGLIIAVCSSFLPFAERILYYTKAYIIFAVPYACSLMRGRKKSIIMWGECITMFSMTIIGMVKLEWYAVLPYYSIFTEI